MASIHLVRAFGCGHLLHPYFPAVWSSGQNSWFNCVKLWAGSEFQIVGCSGKNGKLKVSGAKVLCIWSSSVLHSVVAFWYFDIKLWPLVDSPTDQDPSSVFWASTGFFTIVRISGWHYNFAASPHWFQTIPRFWDSSEWSLCGLTEIFRVLWCPPGVKAVKDAWMVLLH